jgi:putative phage-type endonuclease
MKIIDVKQGTPEWLQVRLGIPTASNFDKLITTKGAPSKQAMKYIYKLAGEKVCGMQEEGYSNANMERGVEMEAEARMFYELTTGEVVEQVGFCLHEDGYGCSPDGFVGEDGLIEIKCPTISVHVGYLIGKELPDDYFQQVQGQLMVTGRKWCDFLSYYPGIKPFLIRVKRDEPFILALREELKQVTAHLSGVIEKITNS